MNIKVSLLLVEGDGGGGGGGGSGGGVARGSVVVLCLLDDGVLGLFESAEETCARSVWALSSSFLPLETGFGVM